MNYMTEASVKLPLYKTVGLQKSQKRYVPQPANLKGSANCMLLDLTLARHCAPVLLGKKPSALFPKPVWWDALLPQRAAAGDLHFLLLRRNKTGPVFAYSPQLLPRTLESEEARETLGALGYPVDAEDWGERTARCLAFLERRFRESADFPHEVGFFLGYPPDDVVGFMRHRGNRCKLCGMWKVYGDVPKAVALFAEYAKCREQLTRHVLNGGGIIMNNDGLYIVIVNRAGF
ncbi:MAG: DUF3793 family protein [Spirochaetaceae bacterium]|jgi:hypothetical protein|nr:DUF3793 family protein [Spirochaetaceae bacterium]